MLEQVVAGQLNKQIAAALGTVERPSSSTGAIPMRKMGVRTVAELVKLVERASVPAAR